ncbi:hypothetical protein DXG03_004020 [Asterophora parasitica]|uniref:Uncharacterized protein n=1 Tax=Asterophora parasitica TaxID=117018 RepID=A0A9P7KAG5_9AGAR|nr:hypothetical protein DXG03_004020 [Asterophora parasitica]
MILYSNSLLATLNARKMIRGSADGVHSTSENLSLSLRDFPKNSTVSSRVSSSSANEFRSLRRKLIT